MKNEVKIFVYGTLKMGGYYARHFDSVRIEAKPAMICGAIYDGAPYPRLRLDKDGKVYGEIHTYREPDAVLERMDMIEGYRKGSDNNLYNRKKVKVVLEDGSEEEAYIYEYAEDLDGRAKVIENGKWEI